MTSENREMDGDFDVTIPDLDEDNGEVEIPEYTRKEMNLSGIREGIQEELNQLELEMYEQWRKEFSRWAFHMGKEPEYVEGYSASSMYNIVNSVEKFAEWLYTNHGFTTKWKQEHLDAYWVRVLQKNDNQVGTNRRNINNVALVLKHRGEDYSIPNSESVYRKINKEEATGFEDYFSPKELTAVKQAALRLYAVPHRDELSADEIDEWSVDIAQRLGIPKHELSEEDWRSASSYKIPSLIYVCADVGFRPTEVNASQMTWLALDDEDDARLQIPKDEDSKEGDNNWRCVLSTETARLLQLWLDERESLDKYDEGGSIWLNRHGNPYNAGSTREIVQNLMQEAGLDIENRENGLYMIRRAVGTQIANEKGLSAVMEQLRINSMETARRYVQSNEEALRDWMDKR
ncbi:hypothetical protein GCM10028857_03270 [Salinarchaeum chitinilyticum]